MKFLEISISVSVEFLPQVLTPTTLTLMKAEMVLAGLELEVMMVLAGLELEVMMVVVVVVVEVEKVIFHVSHPFG